MACCIIRVSSSSSVSMHKVTTNVQRASLGALLGVTGNDGFEREGSQNVVWTRRQYQIMFCKPCENKIWCFHSPLQQWLHGPEYSMRDLHYLSLNSATYNSWAWLQNNRQFRPTKKLRHMRRKLIPTTRGLRRVLFSHQWRQVPPLMSIKFQPLSGTPGSPKAFQNGAQSLPRDT